MDKSLEDAAESLDLGTGWEEEKFWRADRGYSRAAGLGLRTDSCSRSPWLGTG